MPVNTGHPDFSGQLVSRNHGPYEDKPRFWVPT